MTAAVITCSNRSAAGERADDSGALLTELLEQAGHSVTSRDVVPDDVEAIQSAVRAAVDAGAAIVITTGGTGLAPTDVTPEAVRPLLQREVPGIAEAVRLAARDRVPTSVLSRGVAGTVGRSLVVTLPGSPGGVRDGMAVLTPLLGHIVDQRLNFRCHRSDRRSPTGRWRMIASDLVVAVSDQPLDVAAHERAVMRTSAGAHVVFCGVVRDLDHGRHVTELEYEGHPSAANVLREVALEFAQLPDVSGLAVSHRVGRLAVGDVALVAAVSTPHRREAFDVCARLVDEVKRRLPIWKRQVFDDGTDEWVNCP